VTTPSESTTDPVTAPETPTFWSSFEVGDPQPDPVTVDSDADRAEADDADGVELASEGTDGPSTGYTAKRRVGFTGVRCLGYSGAQRADGRARISRQIFAVQIPVTETSQLSYKIMPSDPSDGRALPAPGSYVAVDLAFSDGTRLSDLDVRDQY